MHVFVQLQCIILRRLRLNYNTFALLTFWLTKVNHLECVTLTCIHHSPIGWIFLFHIELNKRMLWLPNHTLAMWHSSVENWREPWSFCKLDSIFWLFTWSHHWQWQDLPSKVASCTQLCCLATNDPDMILWLCQNWWAAGKHAWQPTDLGTSVVDAAMVALKLTNGANMVVTNVWSVTRWLKCLMTLTPSSLSTEGRLNIKCHWWSCPPDMKPSTSECVGLEKPH